MILDSSCGISRLNSVPRSSRIVHNLAAALRLGLFSFTALPLIDGEKVILDLNPVPSGLSFNVIRTDWRLPFDWLMPD